MQQASVCLAVCVTEPLQSSAWTYTRLATQHLTRRGPIQEAIPVSILSASADSMFSRHHLLAPCQDFQDLDSQGTYIIPQWDILNEVFGVAYYDQSVNLRHFFQQRISQSETESLCKPLILWASQPNGSSLSPLLLFNNTLLHLPICPWVVLVHSQQPPDLVHACSTILSENSAILHSP